MTSPVVIHLAAGEGTRLRPYTTAMPKPMVELGGMSLLERNVETLKAAGVTEQIAVTGHCADVIEAIDIQTVHNPIYDQTDMVYSLFCARDRFPTDRDLVISYGDIIYEQNIVDALLGCEQSLCVVVDREWRRLWELRFDDPLDDAETLRLNGNQRITEIGAPAQSYNEVEGQYIGLIKLRADRIETFADQYDALSGGGEGLERDSVEMTHFIQSLIDGGWTVQGVPVDGGWLEVDTVNDFETYRSLHDEGSLQEIIDLEADT